MKLLTKKILRDERYYLFRLPSRDVHSHDGYLLCGVFLNKTEGTGSAE